jgi:PAS domain-containing protein
MLGYTAEEVMNKITPADISDPQEIIARAQALSVELGTPIAPGFEALVFKASRGIEDIYELTYIRKDGSRFPPSFRSRRCAMRIGHHRLSADRHRQHRAQAGGRGAAQGGALQQAIFNSANFSSIATDAKGVIQIFNVGAERMLGYTAEEVMNKITPADISDPQEVIARAKGPERRTWTPIAPGFEALVFKASRGIEDIYELTYIRKDGSRFPPSCRSRRCAMRKCHHRLSADRHRQHRAQAGGRGAAQGGSPAEGDFQQRQFLQHCHRRKGCHPDLQRRRRADAGLHRRRGDEQDHSGRHLRSAGGHRARRGAERRTWNEIAPGFEALVFKASRGIEDIYELTYIRKDGSRFPAVVSVTALRDADRKRSSATC